MEKISYAILGAGNGGQTLAAKLSLGGFKVNLYDYSQELISKIAAQGYISIKEDGVEAKAYVNLLTTDMEEAIKDTDIVMVVNPAIYHGAIAAKCAPYLTENQIVFLHPGSTFGALEFRQKLMENNCRYTIPVSESNTLLYACRAVAPGNVHVGGKKDRILVATLPAEDNPRVCNVLKEAFPEIEEAKNIMVTSFDNTNPIFHPAPTLLSSSWVESGKDFLYYYEGISQSIGEFILGMDKERVNVGIALGLEYGVDLIETLKQYEIEYGVKGINISEVVKNVAAYSEILGPKTLKTRYIYEDIPTGLVPLVSLGKQLGVRVEKMELIIKLAEQLLNEDFTTPGRTVKNLGIEGMSPEELMEFSKSGYKNN